MNADRAAMLLSGLVHGNLPDATPDELAVLHELEAIESIGLLTLRRAEALDQLSPGYDTSSQESTQAALAELSARLRSEWHRGIVFEATLRREEEDRGLLRMIAGFVGDPAVMSAVYASQATRRRALPEAPFVPGPDGSAHAITARGRDVMLTIHANPARAARVDLRRYLKDWASTEARMAALAKDYATLLPPLGVWGQKPGSTIPIAITLLKSGLPAGVALDRFREARDHVSCPVPELPHLSAALVRISVLREASLRDTGKLFAATVETLADVLGLPKDADVRSAARTLIARKEDVPRAVERCIDAYPAAGSIRLAARLAGAPDDPRRAHQRLDAAARRLAERHLPRAAAVTLATGCDDDAFDAEVDRFDTICDELLAQRAFRRREAISPDAAELVNVPGEAKEVVEVTRRLVAHLPTKEALEGWGESDDFAVAVAVARRFAR